ncbi:phage tail protein, partial [Acinetobacter sp. WCHAc060007]|uniref:phage tail protein n=1 Tax=Acinetobacter sp. WCHAc060007 TaxID=2419605 RepID=UPI000EA26273
DFTSVDEQGSYATITTSMMQVGRNVLFAGAVDGVPSGSDIGIYLGVSYSTLSQTAIEADINPAHIIRECLTNSIWGIGVSESNIDDVSFKKAADTLFVESMGMSIKWSDSTSINEFVDNVKEHVNAQLYLDRITNKWKLYLIRDDYDANSLISLNESNIRNLDFERRTLAECVNSVTVTYWDRERAKDSTVTVQDIARIAQQGGVISQSIDYKGFTNSDLASRVALRDLKTLSSTLASVSFDVDESFSESWHEGMPFKLSDSSYGLSEAVMRIRTIKRGDGINNTVYVEAIEDSFSSPMQSVVEYVPPITSGDSTAKNSTAIAFEVPYIELVEQYGQDEVDAKLSNYSDIGYAGMAAIRPNNQHINASLYVDAGAGYNERTTLDFCPSASLKNAIGYMDSSFELENVAEFELLEANHRIQVNDEIMAFVSFDTVTSVITVKRGCFDTVPQKHVVGSKVFGWDNYSGIDDLEYLSGENVSLKALTLTGSDVLELSEATAHSLILSSRAIRPYPPASVKINDQFYPDEIETDLVLTWVGRNRLQETGGSPLSFFEGGVIAEANTLYQLILIERDENNIELRTQNLSIGAVNTFTFATSAMHVNTRTIQVILRSLRDGYESYQAFDYTVELSQFFSAPYDLTVEFKND